MPIDVQRFNEDPHIIYWTVKGLWSLKELDHAFEQSIALVQQHGTASYIYDIRDSKLIPPNIARYVRNLTPCYLAQLYVDLVIVIGADQFIRLFLNFLSDALQTKCQVYYASSREDAEQFLQQYNAANQA
jgi:hypothetical protein